MKVKPIKEKDMDKGQTNILKGIIYEYGNTICVADEGLVIQGCKLTTIYYNEETDELAFYAGDMCDDNYAEQVFPNEIEMDLIYQFVVENF